MNTYYTLDASAKHIPKHILEDDATLKITYNYYYDNAYNPRRFTDGSTPCVPHFEHRKIQSHEVFEYYQMFFVLINPSDELRTYLALLGIKSILAQSETILKALNELLEADYHTPVVQFIS